MPHRRFEIMDKAALAENSMFGHCRRTSLASRSLIPASMGVRRGRAVSCGHASRVCPSSERIRKL